MTLQITIRQATLVDIPIVARLNSSVQQTHADLDPTRYKTAVADNPGVIADFEHRFESDTDFVYLAEIEGQAVGYVSCQLSIPQDNPYVHPKNRLHIDQIGVEAAYRGQGIGSMLIDYVIDLAKQRAITQISLGVFAANEDAVRLYQRLGFSTESIRMVKTIS